MSESAFMLAATLGVALGAVNAFPGVIGSLVFHGGNELLLNSLKASRKEAELAAIGRILSETYGHGRAAYGDLEEMTLVLGKTAIALRRAGEAFFIVVLTESHPLPLEFGTLLDGAVRALSEMGDGSG